MAITAATCMMRILVSALSAWLLGACAAFGPTLADEADAQARQAGLHPVAMSPAPIKAWLRQPESALGQHKVADTSTALARPAALTVYIEGDGAEWPALRTPPADPTPANALALRLALRDAAERVAYLGRPCQYLERDALAECPPRLWIGARYGTEVLAIMENALDALLRATGARRLRLVGYSGGGVIAALLAARRDDVACLVTVAAPLDIVAWAAALGITPLTESLNPLDHARAFAGVAQTHFAAAEDAVVPVHTLTRLLDALPGTRVTVIDAFDHDCCWVHAWEKLRARTCLAAP